MPPSADSSTLNTPLPPSVEKAYYRKCIALKRRLNEVETANDEAKVRRDRLDRGILKMRLERAILLDDLRRKMDARDGEGSEGSGDEGAPSSPPERTTHRDKRRRSVPSAPAASSNSHAQQSTPSIPPTSAAGVPVGARDPESRYGDAGEGSTPAPTTAQPAETPASSHENNEQRGQVNGNSYEGDREQDVAPTNRAAGVTGEALTAGPGIEEDANGERRIVSSADGGTSGDGRARSSSQHQ